MYECPNCGGNLKFIITRQQLYCEYCDTSVDPDSFYKEEDAEEYRKTLNLLSRQWSIHIRRGFTALFPVTVEAAEAAETTVFRTRE